MPVTIVVGENSYLDLDEANTYFSERLYSESWTTASDEMKAQALIMATRRIDTLPLKGKKVDTVQTLAFPRYIVKPIAFPNRITYPGCIRMEWEKRVKAAVCEEALVLLDGIPERVKLQHQGVHSISIGSLSESYKPGKVKLLSMEALELMRPYLVGAVSIV